MCPKLAKNCKKKPPKVPTCPREALVLILKLTGPSEVRQIIIKGKVLYFNKMFNNWTSSPETIPQDRFITIQKCEMKKQIA